MPDCTENRGQRKGERALRGYELDPCPFCGGEFRWHMLEAIGQRMIKGYAKCDGCGCMLGNDLSAEDGEDLRCEIAHRVNARQESSDEER